MSNLSTYKQIMREYERDRDKSKTDIEEKKKKLYEALPRIQEIDRNMVKIGLSISRAVLGGENAAEMTEKLRDEIQSLQKEKKALLTANNYPENYLEITYRCELCKDSGYGKELQKCRCLKQKLINRYYAQSNLSDILSRENFDAFDFSFYSNSIDPKYGLAPLVNAQTIYERCINFITDFDSRFSNLLFYGDTGLGKTFLCNCIAKDLLDMGKTCLYVTAPRIFKKIEDFRFNREAQENPDEQLEMIYEVDLLIIDDLGSEFATVITNTELFNIINTRLLEKRSVIISTNLSIHELRTAYTDRIASRLYGNYEMLRLFGDDIRLKKKLSGK